MDISQLEAAIIAKLSAAFPDIAIKALPTDPEILGTPTQERQIWVALDSTSNSPPQGGEFDRGNHIQAQAIRFILILRLFDLVTHSGVYPVIKEIERQLTGIGASDWASPAGLYSTGAKFQQFADGLWSYSIGLELNTQLIINNTNTTEG